jgi:isoleucyl-tRNA synthetase
MDQWFIALDQPFADAQGHPEKSLRTLAQQAIGEVKWIPAGGENRIRGAVESRPDWCISRQRAWGVPIPAFFGEDNAAHLDAHVIRALADKIEKHGSNLWFVRDAEQLLEGVGAAKDWKRPLKKSGDTLDVWIDSGCSHAAVLKRNAQLNWPADLYLEGSDQHRGWFQSSLWTALATDAAPPYRSVLTHGFVVDENGRKLSKSDGKPQTADDYVKKYGADLIRLWVGSEDFRSDITLSENIFTHIANTYRNLRNTLMYLLGNLADFDPTRDAVTAEHFTPLDKWALHNLHALIREVTAAFDAYDYHLGVKAIDHFVSVTLSRQYHDILKDRLYTFAPDWPERRAAQTAMHAILRALLGLLAPVLPFTTDEAWGHFTARQEFTGDSIHLQPWPQPDAAWAAPEFVQAAEEIEAILKFRERVNEKLEALRQEKKIGKSLDAQVTITGADSIEPMSVLRRHAGDLPELFIVSQVHLAAGPGSALEISAAPAAGVRCPRSWRWVPELVSVDGFEEKVSPRDRAALLAKYAPQKT